MSRDSCEIDHFPTRATSLRDKWNPALERAYETRTGFLVFVHLLGHIQVVLPQYLEGFRDTTICIADFLYVCVSAAVTVVIYYW